VTAVLISVGAEVVALLFLFLLLFCSRVTPFCLFQMSSSPPPLQQGPFAGDKPNQLKWSLAVVNVVGISFYASPLTALRGVLRARSSAALCAPMSAVAFANCCTWIYYGLAIDSMGVVIPSVVGAVLSSVQLLSLLVFPSGEKPSQPALEAKPAL
jgi:hypothetical protein